MHDIDKPTSFPRFQFLPSELRLDIWHRALDLEQWTRELRFGWAMSGRQMEDMPIPTKSLISPLLLVNRESRGEALRRYPNSMRVFGPGVPGQQEQKHPRRVPVGRAPAGRVHVNWHRDTLYVGTVRRVWDWSDKGPWAPDLAYWVQCRARDREYRGGETGRIRIAFEARPEGWWYLPRLRLGQREERDGILAVRNLFV
ncbi:uncharacterized protein PG986_010597 [Apiospora aurea]|uniref:2EXR domain-containing protein n=1 Tax=Apiospora aurea TaxID=335848 RepID=A0ABR1Q2P1_9PEZI